MPEDTQTAIDIITEYIVRSVGYLKLPKDFKKQFGNLKKYEGEPKVAATISNDCDCLTISYTFKIDNQTNKIIENEE